MREWMLILMLFCGLHGGLSASEKLEAFSLKTVIETAVNAYECATIYVAVAELSMQRVTISCRHDIVLYS